MEVECIPLRQTGQFSDFFLDYTEEKEALRPFYNSFPTLENIAALAEKRRFTIAKRELLHDHLLSQYEGIEMDAATLANISKLKDKRTFTVTTGHQLNIFTGPLYFIYKIVTAIDLAERLNALSDGNHYVPVYWMATEDHDLAEIDHFHLKGKTYRWQTEQTGAVGRMKTENFKKLFDSLPLSSSDFERHYLEQPTLAKATMALVNQLFKDSGLVILDADAKGLKAEFAPAMQKELTMGLSAEKVRETNSQLEKLGHSPQIHARDINLFYMTDGARERIVKVDGGNYALVDSERKFTKQELLQDLEDFPERFSPNVVLRPLYQEVVLPNLTYMGGPAEVVYWLQLKSMFGAFDVDFPAIMPRKFVLILDKKAQRLMDKLNLKTIDLFRNTNALLDEWVSENSDNDPNVDKERRMIISAIESISQKAEATDFSLKAHVDARKLQVEKIIDHIEHKILKAQRKRYNVVFRNIETLKKLAAPSGIPQERIFNILEFNLDGMEIRRTLSRCGDNIFSVIRQ